MRDQYKNIRQFLGEGSHPETAARMAGGFVYLNENSGVPGTGVVEPKDEYTAFGVRMPSNPKKPVDVRPQYAYDSSETMVGWIQAIASPSRGEAPEDRYGAHISMDVKYSGQRISPQGIKRVFDTESEAKEFVSDGEKVAWIRPTTVDPWESMDNKQRWIAGKMLAEDLIADRVDNGKFYTYISNLHEAKCANPFAVCTDTTGEKLGKKRERCIKKIKKQNVDKGCPEEGD